MLGSQPLLHLNDALVFSECLFEDFLILSLDQKYADSRKISFVSLVTPDFKPPKIPAIHIGSELLFIIKSCLERIRSTPSKVVNLYLAQHLKQ